MSTLSYNRYQLQQLITLNRKITSSLHIEEAGNHAVNAVAVPNLRENHEFRRLLYYDENTRAALVVPLTVHNEAIGTLAAYLNTPHTFSKWEISIVSTIAGQAASAIENARLH